MSSFLNLRRRMGRQIVGVLIALIAAASLITLSGCNRNEHGDDVMATVNGEKITRAEVDKYYNNQTTGSPQPLEGEQAISLRMSILRQLIDDEIMMQRARKLGLLASDEEVDAKLSEFKAGFSQEEFNKRLQERHLTLDDFKQDLRRTLTVDKVINREITSKIDISDADVTNYYNQHKSEFNLIEPQYHLAQIVVTLSPNTQVTNLKNDKAANEAEARKKVQLILEHLDAGEDFATIAMNYSEQPGTASNGGDMGFVPESTLKSDKQVYDAVSKLKAGQYSGALPMYDTPGHLVGFSIFKLIAREPAGQRELADPRVQAAIRQQLRDRREQLLKTAYYETVRNGAKVENYYAEDLLKNAGDMK